MANQHKDYKSLSDRALEMIMRDVMDGLQEWSLESAYCGSQYGFEIIQIEQARRRRPLAPSRKPSTGECSIIPLFPKRGTWG